MICALKSRMEDLVLRSLWKGGERGGVREKEPERKEGRETEMEGERVRCISFTAIIPH